MLIAASVPPVLYLLTKKRTQSWLQNLEAKWVIKKAKRRARKGKENRDSGGYLLFIAIGIIGGVIALLLGLEGLAILLFILAILGLFLLIFS